MAVNNVLSEFPSTQSFYNTTSPLNITLIGGMYSVSYSPSTASVTITGADANSATLTNGSGIFVNLSTQTTTITSNIIPVNIVFQSIISSVASSSTKTLETISASGTYTQTGTAKVVVIGGGGGGQRSPLLGAVPTPWGAQPLTGPGQGGAGGKVIKGVVSLPGNVPVTIGAGGIGNQNPSPPTDGGDTIFGSLSSANGVRAAGGIGFSPTAPVPQISPGQTTGNAGLPGSPGESIVNPIGLPLVLTPTVGGIVEVYGPSQFFSPAGNIAAGGAGTGYGQIIGPNNSNKVTHCSGGGGGVPGNATVNIPPSPAPSNAAARAISAYGGAGRVFLIRI